MSVSRSSELKLHANPMCMPFSGVHLQRLLQDSYLYASPQSYHPPLPPPPPPLFFPIIPPRNTPRIHPRDRLSFHTNPLGNDSGIQQRYRMRPCNSRPTQKHRLHCASCVVCCNVTQRNLHTVACVFASCEVAASQTQLPVQDG